MRTHAHTHFSLRQFSVAHDKLELMTQQRVTSPSGPPDLLSWVLRLHSTQLVWFWGLSAGLKAWETNTINLAASAARIITLKEENFLPFTSTFVKFFYWLGHNKKIFTMILYIRNIYFISTFSPLRMTENWPWNTSSKWTCDTQKTFSLPALTIIWPWTRHSILFWWHSSFAFPVLRF